MKTFSINNKVYKAKDIDYNMICDFEYEGVSMDQIQKKPMSALRLYISYCMNVSYEEAGQEIGLHLVNSGTLEDVFQIFKEAIEESTFFQAIQKKEEETVSENTPKEGKGKA